MPHLLVAQLRFARAELVRCLEGVSDEEARRRRETMNCISWIVGHLAAQEHLYWLQRAQEIDLVPGIQKRFGWGCAPSSPPLEEVWSLWRSIAEAADPYLDALTPEQLQAHLLWQGEPLRENVGTLLLRNITHYWFHIGEAHAIRQMLGHQNLPQFVGAIPGYQPEE